MIRYNTMQDGTRRPTARFCHAGCRNAMREDRRAGAIYPAIRTPAGSYSAERWSLRACSCAYCEAPVPGRPRLDLPPEWPTATA